MVKLPVLVAVAVAGRPGYHINAGPDYETKED